MSLHIYQYKNTIYTNSKLVKIHDKIRTFLSFMEEWWRQMVGRDPKSQRPLSKCSVGHQRGLFLAFTNIVRADTVFPVRYVLRIFYSKNLAFFKTEKNALKSERNLWIACIVFSLFLLSFPLFVRKPVQGCRLSIRNLFLPSRSLINLADTFLLFFELFTNLYKILTNSYERISLLFGRDTICLYYLTSLNYWTCAMELNMSDGSLELSNVHTCSSSYYYTRGKYSTFI